MHVLFFDLELMKQYPAWKYGLGNRNYDLYVKVVDGKTCRPIPKLRVRLYNWDQDKAEFVLEACYYSNKMGIVDVMNLPCSDGNMISVSHPKYPTQTRHFRPLNGQHIKKFFRLWKSLE